MITAMKISKLNNSYLHRVTKLQIHLLYTCGIKRMIQLSQFLTLHTSNLEIEALHSSEIAVSIY
jgi:hypothetical protein